MELLQQLHTTKYMKPFKNRILYFHPKKHIPAVKWTRDLNISTVEARTFCYCQNKQNITNTGDCNKYTIKYIGKIDEQNYVIVHKDSHKNGLFYNAKISSSKYKIMNADINNDEYVNNIEDRIDVGSICHTNARINLEFHQWRQLSPNRILILKENDGGTYLDKINEFSIR